VPCTCTRVWYINISLFNKTIVFIDIHTCTCIRRFIRKSIIYSSRVVKPKIEMLINHPIIVWHFFHITPTGVYNTSFWSIRRIQYYRRKHDNLSGSEKNIFWSKNVIFFNINLCVSRLLVQTTRFVVKYLQKPLTCKAETCSTVHKVPSL
jgi:hypothetical protein